LFTSSRFFPLLLLRLFLRAIGRRRLRVVALGHHALCIQLLHGLAQALRRDGRAVVLFSVLADAAVGLRAGGERKQCEGGGEQCDFPSHGFPLEIPVAQILTRAVPLR
jgi:hypothetical protein